MTKKMPPLFFSIRSSFLRIGIGERIVAGPERRAADCRTVLELAGAK